ncbi:MAG: glycine oxidase ThiO [Pirellulales bacterium]|jgi:glycine oxidase
MVDVGIIGSGIIGLSLARELASRGLSTRVLTREPASETTSWAASGIFPPAPDWPTAGPADRLTTLSDRLHWQWHEELLEETGIDNGLAACGGLYLAVDEAGAARLRTEADAWRSRGCDLAWLSNDDIRRAEPGLAPAATSGLFSGAYLLPAESQIRPPRHLKALLESCRQRGVEIVSDTSVTAIDCDQGRISIVHSLTGDHTAGMWVLAGGAWSAIFAEVFGRAVVPRPVRGQIALLRQSSPSLSRIVNVGLEYLVPRPDGRVLVGSTLEDAGFDLGTTEPAIQRMLQFARRLVPELTQADVEKTWSGMRPGSPDGLPWIGRSPNVSNGFVATGHFRAGWHQSPGTARLLADLMTGATPPIDPTPYAVDRGTTTSGTTTSDSTLAMVQRAAADIASIQW